MTGLAGAGGPAWTAALRVGCEPRARYLLCYEAPRIGALANRPLLPAGLVAFVSRGSARVSGGVPELDALCATEAAEAGLQGDFIASVSTQMQSAHERLTSRGAWKRPDGTEVGPYSSLGSPFGYLSASMSQLANGEYLTVTPTYVASGVHPAQVDGPSTNCQH